MSAGRKQGPTTYSTTATVRAQQQYRAVETIAVCTHHHTLLVFLFFPLFSVPPRFPLLHSASSLGSLGVRSFVRRATRITLDRTTEQQLGGVVRGLLRRHAEPHQPVRSAPSYQTCECSSSCVLLVVRDSALLSQIVITRSILLIIMNQKVRVFWYKAVCASLPRMRTSPQVCGLRQHY